MERYPSGACPAGLTVLSLMTHYIRISEEEQVQPHLLFFLISRSPARKEKSPLPSLSGNGRAAAGGADAGVVSAAKRTGRQRLTPLPAHTKVRSLSVPMKEAPAGASFFTLPAGKCRPEQRRSRAPPLCTTPVLPAVWSPSPGASPSARRPSPPAGSVPGSARCP